jgi:hypothetical protein
MAQFAIKFISNETEIELDTYDTYNGECAHGSNSLTIEFKRKWSVTFNYSVFGEDESKKMHSLNEIILKSKFDNTLQVNNRSSLKMFSAKVGDSYKCFSSTRISLGNVTVELRDYHAQPFMNLNKNLKKSKENFGTGKLNMFY